MGACSVLIEKTSHMIGKKQNDFTTADQGFSGYLCQMARYLFLTGLVFGLAACQPVTIQPTTIPTGQEPATSTLVQETEPDTVKDSELASNQETDFVGNLIEKIEEEEQAPAVLPEQEILTAANRQAQPVAPLQTEKDILAEKALKAALSLLKDKPKKASDIPAPFVLPAKPDDQLRIGLILPFSGPYAALGRDIARGAELALFQLQDKKIEIFYFDTKGGSHAAEAAREAVAAKVDILIGPLFTNSVMEARTILNASAVPVISLSNNIQAAAPGHWVLGYLPEQQIDHLLGHVISQNKGKIAILAAEDPFGQRLLSHTQKRLTAFGIAPSEVVVLSQPILDDEDQLKQAIQRFTRYEKPAPDALGLRSPAYDAVILAGNPKFILTVAPMLGYYDMDPSRVLFLGTDLWARAELLAEPSLQGALITQAPQPQSPQFEARFQTLFDQPSNDMVKLGFDAFALVAVTKQTASQTRANATIDWRASLLRNEGFAGLSGRFNLLPDGQNQRQYEIKILQDNRLVPR